MGEANQVVQDLWWTRLINPYTLQFAPDLEAEVRVLTSGQRSLTIRHTVCDQARPHPTIIRLCMCSL